jgi:hypothetical protein
VRRGEVSSPELVELHLERIERLGRRTRGFIGLGAAIPRPVVEWAKREDDGTRMRPFFVRYDVLVTPAAHDRPSARGSGKGSTRSARCSGWR